MTFVGFKLISPLFCETHLSLHWYNIKIASADAILILNPGRLYFVSNTSFAMQSFRGGRES